MKYLVLFLSLNCWADHNAVQVTEKQLVDLKLLGDRMTTKSARVLLDFDDPQIMPSARDRRDFREDMETLTNYLKEIERWIEDVKHSPNPEPNPQPNPQPEPAAVKVEVPGFYVVGLENTEDYAKAMQSFQTECEGLRKNMKELFPGVFYTFNCTNPINISRWANIKYFQMASSPILTVKVPGHVKFEKFAEGSIQGTDNLEDPYKPWKSWWNNCQSWLKGRLEEYGVRLVAASCGEPQNVSKWANIGYKQYASTGNVYLVE